MVTILVLVEMSLQFECDEKDINECEKSQSLF